MSEEGEDPLPPPKRKIKKAIVSSASSSDSDDSSPTTSTRKKRLRVLSDDGSDSSSGSWAMGAVRRRRALPGLRDSEADSDSSGWASDQSNAPPTADMAGSSAVSKSPANKAKNMSGFSSDSSEGNSEKCSICLMKFLNQEVGIPQNCEHIFCLDCITEWSKNMNTCPVDRITFDTIVVRAFVGGRVLRTEAVKVAERRPSLEMMIIEDPTVCEVCHNADREESMLLCDGCDLGFHMQCLTPPLTRIPEDQWLCPNCSGVWRSSPIMFPSAAEAAASAERAVRGGGGAPPAPRARRAPAARARAAPAGADHARRAASRAPSRRKTKRRRTKKRRVKRRQPRTAARRTHVLASVRAALAAVRGESAAAGRAAGAAGTALVAQRASAGIPALSLFGSEHQLDYFENEEELGSEGATAAVAAVRPTSGVLSAYRQARRKMFRIPSPSHASAAPDLLSDILERQTLLHSRRSVVSVTVDGSVNIELQPRPARKRSPRPQADAPLAERREPDLSKGGAARQAPAYPGQGRGWGGGYRYPRDRGNHQQSHAQGNPNYGRGGGGYDNGYGGGARAPYERRDDAPHFNDYSRRHLPDDEPWHDRNRRQQPEQNRGPFNPRNEERRYSAGPAWRARGEGPQRQSFGGFENPLDMRVAPEPPARPARPSSAADQLDKRPHPPLPQPPSFDFPPAPSEPPAPPAERDRSEDERSDEGLVIDTEKYDPTEPTHDDDSGDEAAGEPDEAAGEPSPPPPAPAAATAPAPPPSAPSVETILAGLDSRALAVPAAVLDSAVRAALHEHRALLAAPDDGDCPNFSIYSATSVHIASDCSQRVQAAPAPAPARRDSLEDLVQEDGGATPPPAPAQRTQLDDYKAKVSKRCPITTNTRNPIKIKLNAPSLIKRQVSLYDDEDVEPEPADDAERPAPAPEPAAAPADEPSDAKGDEEEEDRPRDEPEATADVGENDAAEAPEERPETGDDETGTPHLSDDDATPERPAEERAPEGDAAADDLDDDRTEDELETDDKDKNRSDSEDEASSRSASPRSSPARAAKMTESISETEDERSYTPCLDENKSKDASLEDKGIEGLDTEMISEEEGNDMFSEGSPPAAGAPPPEDGEILDRRPAPDDPKRKRRKDGKKDKGKGRKRAEVAFKKGGKAKERNYRERDKDKEKRRSRSSSRRRKDKRKDLERYDVRTLVSERRRRTKDAFGRDVSPDARSPSPAPRRASSSPARRARFSPSPPRRRPEPEPRRLRPSPSPRRLRPSPSPRRAPSSSPARRSASPKRRRKRSGSRPKAARRRRSTSRARKRRRSASPAESPKPVKAKKKKRARSPRAGSAARSPRRRSVRRKRARRRASPAAAWSPPPAAPSPRTPPPHEPVPLEERRRRRELERARRRTLRPDPQGPSKEVFTSGDNILVSVSFKEAERAGAGGASAAERSARAARRAERRRRRAAPDAAAKPVAIIDLERSPFRELTPSPRNVIVLSDDEPAAQPAAAPAAPPAAGPKTPPDPAAAPAAAATAAAAAAAAEAEARGPLTPPEPPESPDAYDPYEPTRSASGSPRAAPPSPSPAASPSPSHAPAPGPPSPGAAPAPALDDEAPPSMTLEAAQKTNLSADEVLDRRPLSPIEKVMALLASTRDVSPEEPQPRSPAPPPAAPAPAPAGPAPAPAPAPAAPAGPAPRVLLPEAPRATPKLFLAKPSPIKSDPIKPMPQATKISRLPLPVIGVRRASPAAGAGGAGGGSPYSPGSSDFGDLFSPPPAARRDAFDALQDRPRRTKRNGKPAKRSKKSKTVDVKLDDDNLKILDELPSSAVEMQVKSKFLKKLNRQERVVEEVKLVLKPHYNKKHVSKDEYKHILRRAVPKICHNKTGEINPMKIQALVEAYVKKFRKKRKLGQ